MNPWLHPVIVYRIFFIEAEDVVGDSEFQKLNEFFSRDFADISETGMLVKRALTSNVTKVSSSCEESIDIKCD